MIKFNRNTWLYLQWDEKNYPKQQTVVGKKTALFNGLKITMSVADNCIICNSKSYYKIRCQ